MWNSRRADLVTEDAVLTLSLNLSLNAFTVYIHVPLVTNVAGIDYDAVVRVHAVVMKMKIRC